jgi:hypothetical protein
MTEIVNTELTSFRTSIGVSSDSNIASLISEAETRLDNKIVDSNGARTIANEEVTSFRTAIGLGSDSSVATIISSVREEIANLVILDSNNVGSITDTKLTSFRNSIGLGTDSSVGTLITDVRDEISQIVTIDSAGIATIAQSAVTTLTNTLNDSAGVAGSIASAQAGLVQSVSANSDALSEINQKYFVALDDGNTFTGFEVINGDSVSSFTIQANDFALKTQNQTKTPFSVSGDVVSLTNTKVTGNLDVGTGAANSMRLKDDVLKIHDSDGNVRVIIGNLSG